MALRELAERDGDGIVVRLLWDDSAPPGLDVLVDYRDERLGVSCSIRPPRDEALEAFNHPNAYASRTAAYRPTSVPAVDTARP